MIPFSPPFINENVIDEVVDTLRSGWITSGPKVKLLEKEIANFVGVPNVVCVNSWTSGAIMILKWLELEEGDEVIIPAYTYSATALAVLHAGGIPVMVDVGTDFNIDVENIRNAITEKTKAIMPVDFSGYPCNYNEIMELVTEPDIKAKFKANSKVQEQLSRIMIISDAAHSLGALYDGRMMGQIPDITIFSLHAVKNVTTAEGGAIVLNLPEPFSNDNLYKELKMMSLNCQTKDALAKSKIGSWQYDIIGLGMKINMADVNAAIGLAQIREYGELLARRKEVYRRYLDNFEGCEWAILPQISSNGSESSCHLFPLRVRNISEEQRNEMIREISEMGVSVNVHFIPLPLLTYFKGLGYSISDYPATYTNFAGEISLPIYPQLSNSEVDQVIDAVKTAYQKVMSTS